MFTVARNRYILGGVHGNGETVSRAPKPGRSLTAMEHGFSSPLADVGAGQPVPAAEPWLKIVSTGYAAYRD